MLPSMRPLTFESCETLTQEEFASWTATVKDDRRYELLSGRVVMEPPASWPHGRIETALVTALHRFVCDRALGSVLGSSQGFELPSGDTVQPDATFVSNESWEGAPPQHDEFLQVVPDLVVEILSPGNASRDRGEKKQIYERNGVREYWLVDPRTRQVTRFVRRGERFDRGIVFGTEDDVISEVLPGLRIPVEDLTSARP
jgi:Uma2 family endonuclease